MLGVVATLLEVAATQGLYFVLDLLKSCAFLVLVGPNRAVWLEDPKVGSDPWDDAGRCPERPAPSPSGRFQDPLLPFALPGHRRGPSGHIVLGVAEAWLFVLV